MKKIKNEPATLLGEGGLGFLKHFCRDGIITVFYDHLLAVLALDEFHEFRGEGIQGFAGLFVDVDKEETRQGIFAAEAVFIGGFSEAFWRFADGQGADAGGDVTDAGVAECEFIGTDALDHGGRTGLLLDAAFEVAFAEGVFLEEAVGAGGAVTAKEGDGAAFPGIHTELAPVCDVCRSAEFTGRGKYTVNLGQGEALEGAVLVSKYGQGIHGHFDLGRLVAKFLFEGVDLFLLHLTAHRAELAGAADEGWRSGGGAFAFDLNVYIRILGFETLSPKGHEVVKRIGTDGDEISRDTADLFVFRDGGVHFSTVGECGEAKGNEKRRLDLHAVNWNQMMGCHPWMKLCHMALNDV